MAPAAPTSLRARKKAATRARIYQAALALFRQKGFLTTTVEEIAEAAEVSRGTFFNYYPTKEALLQDLGERQTQATAEEIRAALKDLGRPARQRAAHLLRRLAEAFEVDHELSRVAVFEVMKAPDALAAAPYRRLLREALASLLAEGQRRGEVRAGLDTHAAGAALAGLFFQQVFEWCVSETPFGLAEQVDSSMDLLWRGLAPE